MRSTESRLLDLIGDVHGLLDLEEFRHGLVVALKEAIPSDWVSRRSGRAWMKPRADLK